MGNPGPEYEHTRHNFGFMVIDRMLELAAARKSMRLAKPGLSGEFQLDQVCLAQKTYLLLKPFTYMNLSGKAVAKVAGRFQVQPEAILVVHDELDLPLGRMKMKQGGGNGGHKGLVSIEDCLGKNDFFRLRLGVGRPEHSSQVTDYVLGEFAPDEADIAAQVIRAGIKGINIFTRRGPKDAVQFINSFRPAIATTEKDAGEKPGPREQS